MEQKTNILMFEDFTNLYKRWKAGEDRKEDNVDALDLHEFVEYLNKNYIWNFKNQFLSDDRATVHRDTVIALLIWKPEDKSGSEVRLSFHYDSDMFHINKCILYMDVNQLYKKFPDLKRILKEKFSLNDDGREVLPKEGDITNSFCLDVMNTILDNTNDECVIIKRSKKSNK